MFANNLSGKKIFSTTAPSSGAIVLSILKIFEGFDGSAQDDDAAINITTHRRESARSVQLLTHQSSSPPS